MTLKEWLMLLVTFVVGMGALFWAAGSRGGTAYGIGLVVFGVAAIYAFMQIKQHFDRIDAGH